MKTYSDDDYVFVDENGNEYISTPECHFPALEIVVVFTVFMFVMGVIYA
jgi:hypothetical protein